MADGGFRAPHGAGRRRVHAQLVGIFVGMLAAGLTIPIVGGQQVSDMGVSADAPSSDAADSELDGALPQRAEAAAATPETTLVAAGSDPVGASGSGPQSSTDAGASATASGTPAPSSASPPPTGGSQPLTASDTGVTSSTIRLGVPVIDLGNLSRVGDFGPTNPEQQRRSWQAFFDEINAAGGIHGRKLEPFFRAYDALSADDQRAACLYYAQDAKVFAVVGGFNLESPHVCLAAEFGVPTMTLGTVGVNDASFTRAKGRLVSMLQRAGRLMPNFAEQLHRDGFLRGRTLGLMGDESSDPGGKTGDLLVAALERLGYSIAHRSRFPADYGAATSQVPVEVQQMRSKGVDGILMLSHSLVNQPFTQGAESQGYRPRYFTTDWGAQTLDATTNSMAESFDGAIGVTSLRFNDGMARLPEPREQTACASVYEKRYGVKLPRRDEEGREATEFGGVMTPCVMMRIFRDAATSAGPTLTRERYSAALQQLGPVPILLARTGPGGFRPGKTDAPDAMRVVRWRFACKCWQPITEFRRTSH